MILPLFTDSLHCRSRAKCGTCQDAGPRGQAFRSGVAKHFELPAAGLVPCPFGMNPPPLPPPPPPPAHGLGTLARKGIDATTFGLARPLAEALAKIMGAKDCGCDGRERCLNELVPDVREVSVVRWVMLAAKIAVCLGQ